MNQNILSIFKNHSRYYRCPICNSNLELAGQSMICPSRHTFDIAKQGYLNLLMKKKTFDNYDKISFQSRKIILEKGYYNHVLEVVAELLRSTESCTSVLDVGCGEGFYSRKLSAMTGKDIVAFDISKESVQIAAKADLEHHVSWFVGDLSDLPIADSAIDCILNIFTPANYGEFQRVLSDNGMLIKVVPGSDHLIEFRRLVRDHLRNKDFSNEQVVECFQDNFSLISRTKVSKTFELPEEDCRIFAEMTPLFFNVDKQQLDLSAISSLTVEAEILVGKPSTPCR